MVLLRPQRSCDKVMFSQASVILSTVGTPPGQTPLSKHPPGRHPLPPADGYCSRWYAFLLPPANVVCEGYVFTGVCLSIGGGIPACIADGIPACLAAGLWEGGGIPACLAGFQATPKGEVEGGLAGGGFLQAHTQGGS